MAKSSFAKPGASAPAKTGTKPAPAKTPPKPAVAPAVASKPTPKPSPARPSPASKPTPAAVAPRPTPSRPTPRRVEEPPVEEQQQLAIVEAGAEDGLTPAVTQNLMQVPLGSGEGQMGPGDFALPKLKLVQGIGPLAEAGFEAGQLVLNDTLILWETGCEPIEITILRYVKQFVENLPYGSDEFPRMFATAEDAQAAGLSTEWGPNGEKPEVLPQLNAMILIKQPDGVEADEFPLQLGDHLYAVAMWRISGTSYPIVKTITSAQRARLKNGLHTGTFRLTSSPVKTPKFSYHVLTLQPGEAHSEGLIAEIVAASSEM